MKNLRLVLAQQEQSRSQRKRSRAMILGPEDLPGANWIMLNERVFRTGSNSPGGEIAERALKAGGYTTWRELTRGGGVGFWAQVNPWGTTEDATIAVKMAPSWEKKNPNFEVELVEELIFEGDAIPGVTSYLRQERRITSKAGAQTVTSLYGNVDEIFFALSGLVPWNLMDEIAALQADKIRRGFTKS